MRPSPNTSSGIRGRPAVPIAVLLAVLLAVLVAVAGCTAPSTAPVADGDSATPGSTGTPTTTTPSAPTEPSEETSGAATPPAEPSAPRPAVGDCRDLTWGDTGRAVTDAAADPVACGDATGQTFAVGQLEADWVTTDGSVDVDAVSRATAPDCRSALIGWLGGNEADYELSMMAYVVAVPPAADVAVGARWYRCDTFGTVRPGRLAELPRTTQRLLTGSGADAWAVCVDGPLGADQEQVLCRKPHDWRGISAHRLGAKGDDYPGDRAVLGRARGLCEADARVEVDDPLESFDYGWLRPTRSTWAGGQRFVLCFAETRA